MAKRTAWVRPRTSKEEIALIRERPGDKHSIKLVSILYGQSKRGSDDETLLYNVLIRRCVEENQNETK